MTSKRFACAVLLSCVGIVVAQVPPQFRLKATGSVVSSEKIGGLFMPVKCDGDGNLYLRSMTHGEKARQAVRTIRKFEPSGALKATFAVDSIPDLSDFDSYDFAVSPDGDVSMSAATANEIYVLSFGKDGRYKSKTKLDHLFKPTQLAVFKSGDLLVSGVELPKTEGDKSRSFAAIFSSSGKLVKELRLGTPTKAGASTEADDDQFNSAVELGIALIGKDGNAYLLRHTSPAVVRVISPSGELVRKLTITVGNRPLLPDSMALTDGKLLLMFAGDQHEEAVLELVDSQSGEVEAEYVTSPELGAALACFDGKELTFVGRQDDGRMLITHAAPR